MKFVIVTGLSGSGKSTAVDVLEDIGYYCIDNMPPELIGKFAEISAKAGSKLEKVAFVADIRGGDFFLKLDETIKQLRAEEDIKVLFLDSSDDVIIRRYKETRRKHPLDEVANGNIKAAIETERKMLVPIKEQADFYIDTSLTSTSKFKERVYSLFLESGEDFLRIDVCSFGFKYGTMNEADLVFDVRCLPNPFYIPELKEKTGLNKEVYDYVLSFDEAKQLLDKLTDLLDFLIPLYKREGKSQLIIAFGCTGGKHRSVTYAEAVGRYLEIKLGRIRITHRDIDKH